MYKNSPHSTWVGRRLTEESGKDFHALQKSLRSFLRLNKKRDFRPEHRLDVPYVNVPELHVLRAFPHSALPSSHRAIAQYVFEAMKAETDTRVTDQLTARCSSISVPELHRRYYVGFMLDSYELNDELRLADTIVAGLGGIALQRTYGQRFVPLLSTGSRSIAHHAAQGLQQRVEHDSGPREFTFEPVSFDDNHVVEPHGFVDNVLVSSLKLPR